MLRGSSPRDTPAESDRPWPPIENRGPIDRLFNNRLLRKILLESRALLGLVGMVAVIRWIDPAWFWPGLMVSAAGEALQLWCFACLRKDSILSTDGPYAFCRNPMYVGRFFLILGAVMLLGNLWFLAVLAVAYWFYVVNRVKREERKLVEMLGAPYEEYRRQVHRFFPRLRAFPGSKVLFFDRERFQKNNALVNGLTAAAFFIAAYLLTAAPSTAPRVAQSSQQDVRPQIISTDVAGDLSACRAFLG